MGARRLWALFALGWVTALLSTFLIGHFDMFGLSQVLARWRRRPYDEPAFQVPGLYKLVRHPLYLGFIIAFWAGPDLSAGRLLFAAALTAYILIAIRFEEHDLKAHLGEPYVRYAARGAQPRSFSAKDWPSRTGRGHTDPVKAREPDVDGYVERNGVNIHFEIPGEGGPTILLLPTWTIVHKRFWKAQVPYLARHLRVVTYDGPGNGASDRPLDPAAYDHDRQVAHALAVLDATGTDRAVVVGLSMGGCWALQLAAEHGDRVLGSVLIGASVPITDGHSARVADGTRPDGLPESRVPLVERDPVEHWAKYDPATGRTTTRTSSGSSSACASRSPVDQADRGLPSPGGSTPPRTCSR